MAKKKLQQPGIKTWGTKSPSRKNKGEFEWSAESRRIIPLKNNMCYIFDEKGKTHHVERDSVEYEALIVHLDEIMQGKITRDLQELGWV